MEQSRVDGEAGRSRDRACGGCERDRVRSGKRNRDGSRAVAQPYRGGGDQLAIAADERDDTVESRGHVSKGILGCDGDIEAGAGEGNTGGSDDERGRSDGLGLIGAQTRGVGTGQSTLIGREINTGAGAVRGCAGSIYAAHHGESFGGKIDVGDEHLLAVDLYEVLPGRGG